MRFFWKFQESNTEITFSIINFKIVACFEDLNKLRTWPSAFLRRPMFWTKLKCSKTFWIVESVNDLQQPKILMPSNVLKEHSCRCSWLIAFPSKLIWSHMTLEWSSENNKLRAVISMINRSNSSNPPFTNVEFLWLDHRMLEQTFAEDLKLGTKFWITEQ